MAYRRTYRNRGYRPYRPRSRRGMYRGRRSYGTRGYRAYSTRRYYYGGRRY